MAEEQPAPDLEVGRYALRSFKAQHRWLPNNWATEYGVSSQLVFGPVSYRGSPNSWISGTCEAVCYAGGYLPSGAKRGHQAPDEKCTCGIYASLSYADLIAQFHTEARTIVAVIAAEGITIIGSRGLRTQFARVVAYWVEPAKIFRQAAATQFKDAAVFDNPVDMIDAYGLRWLPPAEDEKSRRSTGGPTWWTGQIT
jgi:hypothetical protein